MWKKFAKINDDGMVISVILSKRSEVFGFVDVTDRDVQVGADFDAETDTFGKPQPSERRLLKALVLIIKANADKITIPPEALEIWQDIKDNRL